jgi:hypothetical protein
MAARRRPERGRTHRPPSSARPPTTAASTLVSGRNGRSLRTYAPAGDPTTPSAGSSRRRTDLDGDRRADLAVGPRPRRTPHGEMVGAAWIYLERRPADESFRALDRDTTLRRGCRRARSVGTRVAGPSTRRRGRASSPSRRRAAETGTLGPGTGRAGASTRAPPGQELCGTGRGRSQGELYGRMIVRGGATSTATASETSARRRAVASPDGAERVGRVELRSGRGPARSSPSSFGRLRGARRR